MESLLVSACLLGFNCKYSGGNNAMPEDVISALSAKYRLIPVCPETAGGLSTPRDPSERQGDRVISQTGRDVTAEYRRGAETALSLAEKYGCTAALMKENSPSCGSGTIYDGTFSHVVIPGDGTAAELLKANGIRVIGESRVSELI